MSMETSPKGGVPYFNGKTVELDLKALYILRLPFYVALNKFKFRIISSLLSIEVAESHLKLKCDNTIIAMLKSHIKG